MDSKHIPKPASGGTRTYRANNQSLTNTHTSGPAKQKVRASPIRTWFPEILSSGIASPRCEKTSAESSMPRLELLCSSIVAAWFIVF